MSTDYQALLADYHRYLRREAAWRYRQRRKIREREALLRLHSRPATQWTRSLNDLATREGLDQR
jgi:hypothetical protein